MRRKSIRSLLDAREDGFAPRRCDWPGCRCEGLYRAPLSRRQIDRHRWLCLDHVRLHNAAWNYYAGMNEAEVEADVRFDSVWQRPSWRLGTSRNPRFAFVGEIRDAFGLLGGDDASIAERVATPEEKALRVLDLDPPLTKARVKARYKELVKRYHPDANPGEQSSEEMFKRVHQAYRTIMDSLTVAR